MLQAGPDGLEKVKEEEGQKVKDEPDARLQRLDQKTCFCWGGSGFLGVSIFFPLFERFLRLSIFGWS